MSLARLKKSQQYPIKWGVLTYPELHSINSCVFQENVASQKVLLKNGFEKIGEKTTTKKGVKHIENIYILKIKNS